MSRKRNHGLEVVKLRVFISVLRNGAQMKKVEDVDLHLKARAAGLRVRAREN